MRDYRGDFEGHLTIQVHTSDELTQFQNWCAVRGCRCVRIVLERGEHREQPMATWTRHNSTLPVVLEESKRFASDLSLESLSVVRVKLEAAPYNESVPRHDSEAEIEPKSHYFEHHVKLTRPEKAMLTSLLALCERSHAHLSRNAFRRTEPGWIERFVTLRTYGVGRQTSEEKLQKLLEELKILGEQIVEFESEYCVYDSNLALDAGWLPA
jgi:hypothetical protein